MVTTVWTFAEPGELACTSRREMVPWVVGCQVMLKVVPATMVVGMVGMVKGFCAAAMVASAPASKAV